MLKIFTIITKEFKIEFIGKNQRGSADLCAYFFLRSTNLIQNNGYCGLVATNTIAQGDTLTFTSAPFGGLPLGAVAANQLATAEDGVARFIYNVGTGLLQYDTNLAAAGGLVGIATLTNTPAITNTQIVIV